MEGSPVKPQRDSPFPCGAAALLADDQANIALVLVLGFHAGLLFHLLGLPLLGLIAPYRDDVIGHIGEGGAAAHVHLVRRAIFIHTFTGVSDEVNVNVHFMGEVGKRVDGLFLAVVVLLTNTQLGERIDDEVLNAVAFGRILERGEHFDNVCAIKLVVDP